MLKIVLMIVLAPAILFGLYVLGNIVYSTITDYQPAEQEAVDVVGSSDKNADSTFSFIIWNIGYGGLGAEMDFFYDGGKSVRASAENVHKYVEGAYQFLANHRNTDFMLLQEVDVEGKRSLGINQVEGITSKLKDHCYSFAMNYNVNFIPIPFTDPMGKVKGGLLSLSKYAPSEAVRFQFPGNFSYPKRLFFLDRCFLLQRIPLKSGKELIVINTHNSAYDDGTLKARQMAYLKEKILSEYKKGNYVVVGGDWNQCPPDFNCHQFAIEEEKDYPQNSIGKDFLPVDWKWVYDGKIPTNRKAKTPYDPAKSFTTVIDFFLVSPNIQVLSVNGVDQGFAFSDHQPVMMEIKIKN